MSAIINLVPKHAAQWEFEEYGDSMCACTVVDIERRAGIPSAFTLMFEVVQTEKGVDGKGNRACGFAHAIVIDGKVKPRYTEVRIGDVVHTPFGDYRVQFHGEGTGYINRDHLTLVPVEKE